MTHVLDYSQWTPGAVGMFRGVPSEVYHASPGVSNSMLGHMDPPSRLPVYLTEKHEPDEWAILGTLIHQRILEPERPLPLIAVQPETYGPDSKKWTYQAKECKAWREAQEAQGLIVLTPDQYRTLIGCITSVRQSSLACEAIRYAETELSLWWELDGILTKRRLDCVPPGNALLDLKSCADGKASVKEWKWEIEHRGYHRQAAFYLDGYNAWARAYGLPEKTVWLWVAVEKAEPYAVGHHQASGQTLERGRAQYQALMAEYRDCLAANKWPGYPEEWTVI